MASVTLEDVTAELMVSNETLGSIRSDTQLMVEYLDLAVDTIKDSFDTLVAAITGDALAKLEAMREERQFQERLLDALDKEDKTNKVPEQSDFGILHMLIAGLGVAFGMLQAQLAAIKLFATQFSPKFIKNMFAAMRKNILGMVMGFALRVNLVFNDVRKAITTALKGFTGFFSDVFGKMKNSKIGKAIGSALKTAGKWLKAFADPFIDMFKMIKGWVSKAGTVGKMAAKFAQIGKYFGTLGGLFSKVAVIAKKLFLPITILMSIYDSIKQSFAEGEKKGASGYITGAIKGLVNSLVMAPLDLVKSGIAWLLGKMGFDESSEALQSFSFEELFNQIIDGIENMVRKAINWVLEFINDPVATLKKTWDELMAGAADFASWMGSLVNKAIDWVLVKFGWKAPETEPFNLGDEISKIWDAVKQWFDTQLDAITPDWLKDLMTTDKTPEQIRAETQSMAETAQEDFGDATSEPQTMRMEPTTSQELDKAQSENNSLAGSGSQTVIVNAPVTTTNNNVDNSTNGTAILSQGGIKKLDEDVVKGLKMNSL